MLATIGGMLLVIVGIAVLFLFFIAIYSVSTYSLLDHRLSRLETRLGEMADGQNRIAQSLERMKATDEKPAA